MPVDISKIIAEQRDENFPAKTQYDSLWGYYTFSQTIKFEYDDAGVSGLSNATIVVNGFFTANSEDLGDETDDVKRDRLFDKYKTLREKLLSCVNESRPSDINDIGTSNDKRCIELPSKLKDNLSGKIYAIPISFSTTEISPEILRYTATFSEPKTVACKLAIGEDIIDDAVVTIVCRRPRIAYRNFVFASGSEAYVSGIDNRKYSVSGSINGATQGGNIDYVHIGSDNIGDSSNSNCVGIKESVVDTVSKIINNDDGIVSIGVQKTSDSGVEEAFKIMLMNLSRIMNLVLKYTVKK